MTSIKIYSTTDVHGHVTSDLFDKMQIFKKEANAILIDNGDFLIGRPYATYSAINYKTSPLTKFANQIGYDVMIPGNHDFDYGVTWLKSQVSHLEAEYICVNVYDAKGERIFKPYTIIQRNNQKIGVIGFMNEALMSLVPRSIANQILVKPIQAILTDIIAEIEDKVDSIVVAYHGGMTADPYTKKVWTYPSLEDNGQILIKDNTQVNTFILGHQHFSRKGQNERQSYIQPGSHGKQIGCQTLTFDDRSVSQNVQLIDTDSAQLFDDQDKFSNWLNLPFPREAYERFIQSHFPADNYLIESDFATLSDFSSVSNYPFPLAQYVLSPQQVETLGLDIEISDDSTIIASPHQLPATMRQKGYLLDLFSQFLIDYFGLMT